MIESKERKLKFVLKSLLFGLLAIVSFEAKATVLVNPPTPYFQHVMGDNGYSIYLGASTSGYPAGGSFGNAPFWNTSTGYRFIKMNATDTDNLIFLDVTSSVTNFNLTGAQHVVVTLFSTASAGNEIPLTGASLASGTDAPVLCNTAGTTCQGTRSPYSGRLSAVYTPGTTLRLSLSISDLCATPGIATGTLNICNGNLPNTLTNTSLTQSIVAVFSVVDNTYANAGAASGTGTDSLTFTLNLTDIPPTVVCPQVAGSSSTKVEDYYFPGDSQVIINANNYSPTSGGTTTTGAPIDSLILFAAQTGTPLLTANGLVTSPVAGVYGTMNYTGSAEKVKGFTNSTNGTDNGYFATIYAQNQVGILSTSYCGTDQVPTFKIFTQPISGVLTESKCFIATAAYHDGRAAPVMMLRKFRDDVLTQTFLGRKFIETYYKYSPALAEWAWDKPIIRSIALRALVPIEMMAWTILKIAHADDQASEPYIEKLKKKIDADKPEATQPTESYSELERRKLRPTPTPTESYIDSVKRKMDQPETPPSPNGYAEDQRRILPEEKNKDSAIQMVKEKRDRYPVPERPPIDNAVGFRFGVAPGLKVNNTNNAVTFDEIYGAGWKPDLWFHYERQFMHSENFGSFGLGADFGISYSEAFGRLKFAFGSTNETVSKTKFSFVQLPVMVDAYYRFNLLRILRPYAGVGVGAMFYTEIRQDGQGDKRGYTPIYYGSGGVSLLLDFLDSSTALDSYLSSGMQHTYFFAEYTKLDSFSKTGVTFERNGIYSGFLFEY